MAVLEKLLQVEPANAAAKALLAEVRQLNERSNRRLKKNVGEGLEDDRQGPSRAAHERGAAEGLAPQRARKGAGAAPRVTGVVPRIPDAVPGVAATAAEGRVGEALRRAGREGPLRACGD